MKNSIIFICALLASLSLQAKIYEYKDAQGETHFSQEPPADGNAVVVKPRIGPATHDSTTTPSTDKKETTETSTNTQEKKEPLDAQTLEAYKINCERSKQYLQEIESKPRIRLQDSKTGIVTFLTDEQRTQEIIKTKAAVQKFCNPSN